MQRISTLTRHLSTVTTMAKRIELYVANTPNAWKVSIALEELKIPYNVNFIDLSKNTQKEPWYLKINPNGRIPAIIDRNRNDFAVFESGAILLYLVRHYDPEHKLSFEDPDLQSQVEQWLFFQNSGLGPMQGQLNHFSSSAKEKIPYAITRYRDESKRLYKVIDDKLREEKRDFIVGPGKGKLTIADITSWSW